MSIERMVCVSQQQSTAEVRRDACADAIFRTVFRVTSIADLYGPDRAIEWAQSLLDDPELLSAFAHPPTQARHFAA